MRERQNKWVLKWSINLASFMHWEKQKPIFVIFEGGEGSGKTTQTQLLYNALKRAGRRVIHNDEPGSTDIGFKIRTILFEADHGKIDPLTEFLLFEVDRSLDFSANIIPWLNNGVDVIQDRNFGSTFAYQGYGRGLIKTHANLMRSVDEAVRRNFYPHLIFLLDGEPKKLLKRISRHKATPFEKESIPFHNLVRKGFLVQARADRKHWVVLNAFESPKVLHQKIWKKTLGLLK